MGKNQNTAPAADQTADNTVDLQAQLDQAIADRAQAIAELAAAKSERDQAIAERDQARTELDEKAEELNQAELLIEEQTGKLAAAEVASAEGPVVVTHAKEQYRVLAPKFQHNGLIVEARSLTANPELVRQLVEAESGVLQKVEATA
ncbi:hypothetical protein [Hymenobacter rubidus]|uniref:hypothetical protein n=1 Tax=Hymenobacter rubidus TaxID=1441626 RepID=UPI00191FACDA|nr:hypothetical protein [Hymenobacter rubidus]